MRKDYKAITDSKKKPMATPSTIDVRRVKRIDKLEPTPETFAAITDLAANGYSVNSIIYMLGATEEMFQDFREEYPDEVKDAIRLGNVIDETECLAILRGTATDKRASNAMTALKTYGALKFGWGGDGTGNVELPTGISFEAIPVTTGEE